MRRLIQQLLSVQRTLPGRLMLLTTGLLLVLAVIQAGAGLPDILVVTRRLVRLGWLLSVVWLSINTLRTSRRQWLWAVRRKLILSYVFFGVFPVVLVGLLFLIAGFLVYLNVAGYVFQTGYQAIVQDAARVAETSVVEIRQNPSAADDVIGRKVANLRATYPGLSVVSIHPSGDGVVRRTAGTWKHLPAPSGVPQWLVERGRGFQGTLALVDRDGRGQRLVIRAAQPSADGKDWVIADLPVDTDVLAHLFDATGAHVEQVTFNSDANNAAAIVTEGADDADAGVPAHHGVLAGMFRTTRLQMDFIDWTTGTPGRVQITLDAPATELYERMAASAGTGNALGGSSFVVFLAALAVLFLIIQLSALIGGVALARRITSSVHDLFEGTARFGQGDFTHRIAIGSTDQLGDLAGSFNNMGASIEHLRHIEREKLRLDEELQIARKIQRSLLPASTPKIPGLCIADLCEPALEVGGDYYDFFALGPRQLAVLVADVSGKGTSAALYMAELKGLVLALSRTHRSPRALLIELNHLLGEHLDNRSFITMTYAVIDLAAGTLTCARAGHTPILVCSGGRSRAVISDGMVLGLRLPGALERFNTLLEEHTQPLHPGDVVVLYTDGITEAMNRDGELFGDTALGEVVAASARLDSAGIRERILRDVRAFVGDAEPHDDMTMVVVKVQEES